MNSNRDKEKERGGFNTALITCQCPSTFSKKYTKQVNSMTSVVAAMWAVAASTAATRFSSRCAVCSAGFTNASSTFFRFLASTLYERPANYHRDVEVHKFLGVTCRPTAASTADPNTDH